MRFSSCNTAPLPSLHLLPLPTFHPPPHPPTPHAVARFDRLSLLRLACRGGKRSTCLKKKTDTGEGGEKKKIKSARPIPYSLLPHCVRSVWEGAEMTKKIGRVRYNRKQMSEREGGSVSGENVGKKKMDLTDAGARVRRGRHDRLGSWVGVCRVGCCYLLHHHHQQQHHLDKAGADVKF